LVSGDVRKDERAAVAFGELEEVDAQEKWEVRSEK